MLPTILMLAALVCFVLSSLGVASRVNLTATGLAFLTTAMIVSAGMLG